MSRAGPRRVWGWGGGDNAARVCRRRLCFFSAVLPEASLQLLPITAGMPPGVRCQERACTLVTAPPLAAAACELLALQSDPSLALWSPPPPPPNRPVRPSVTAAVGSFLRECVSMCGWVWACQGGSGEFMGSWCPINWSDAHTSTSCFARHCSGWFISSLDAECLSEIRNIIMVGKNQQRDLI